MSQSDLDLLAAEEAALAEQMRVIREKKQFLLAAEAERKRILAAEEEMKKPLVVEVVNFWGDSVTVSARFRADLLEVWKSTPGRTFRGTSENLIPVGSWRECEERIKALPNASVVYNSDLEAKIEWHLTAAPWEIDLGKKGFEAKAGPSQINNRWCLSSIPGATWDYNENLYEIPLTEGWRIIEAIKGLDGIVISKAAAEIIFPQIERRAKQDLIAKQETTDFITEVNGFPLMGHQRVFVEFSDGGNGRVVLGDDPGLGKTRSVIAMIERNRKLAREENPPRHYQTLYVTKASLIRTVQREIESITKTEPMIIKGGELDMNLIMPIFAQKIPYTIISYDTLARYVEADFEDGTKREFYAWAETFGNLGFSMLVLDEAHQIKNPGTHRFKACRILRNTPHVVPMTASVVQNRMMEFWPILHMARPDLFPSAERYKNTYTDGGQGPKNLETFHDLLKPFFLRRKKRDVLKDLPEVNRMVIYHDLTPRALKLYNKVLNGVYERAAMFDPSGKGGQTSNTFHVFQRIQRLMQVTAADKAEHFTPDFAKNLIEESPDSRGMIFSKWKGTAIKIAELLGPTAVCTAYARNGIFYSMSGDERDALFERVRHDPKIKYIVTTEAASEGQNIEYINWVIFNDLFWSPMKHHQGEGRSHGRLSNPDNAINSYYITADVQIERWGQEIINEKMRTIDAGVEGIEGSRDDGTAAVNVAKELIMKIKASLWQKEEGGAD